MSVRDTFRGLMPLVIAVGLLSAACSSGPSAEVVAFCDGYVEVQGLMTVGPDESDPTPWVEGLTGGLDEIESAAPEKVSAAVGRIGEALRGPVEALDEEAYFAATQSEGFLADVDAVNAFVGDECGLASVDVTAVDFAFEADLDDLVAGQTMFLFTNQGAELHEMVLIRINDGTTETVEQLLEMPEEEAETKTTFVGVAFAPPGGKNTMFADLDSGRYVILCFVPTGSTSFESAETAEGPPHFTHGMIKEFTVGA